MAHDPKDRPPAEDLSAQLNATLDGWNAAMGIHFVHASADKVLAELTIRGHHLQPYGLVHGGVYAGLIETVASVGAALDAMRRQKTAVGLENHTSFLHAAREGKLHVAALPLSRGSRTQVWEGTITDDSGRTMATGRVRMLCLEPGTAIAGETVQVKLGSRPAGE